MHIGIPLETYPGEARIAATPETVSKLVARVITSRCKKRLARALGSLIRRSLWLALRLAMRVPP